MDLHHGKSSTNFQLGGLVVWMDINASELVNELMNTIILSLAGPKLMISHFKSLLYKPRVQANHLLPVTSLKDIHLRLKGGGT